MDELTINERIERLLAGMAPELEVVELVSYRPISGGYSRVTSVVEVRTAGGDQQKLILRADPPAGKGVFTSDRDREWPLLQAMWDVETLEIPRPRWYEGTGEALGTKCIVMDHVEGTPLQLLLPDRIELAEARAIFLDVAVALIRTPLDELPSDLEQPADWDSYMDSAIDIYVRAEEEIADSSPVVRYVAAWLRANRPPPVPLGLVHGDFQPGNILVAEGQPPVVIDWEFGRIGDPREDVGYYSGSPLPNSLYQADPEAFLAEYRARTGFTEEQVNPQVMEYFFILGMAELFVQMMRGADALSRGESRGIMSSFLINSLSYFHDKYLEICTR